MLYYEDDYPANIASLEARRTASEINDQQDLVRIFKSAGKILRNLQTLPTDHKVSHRIRSHAQKKIKRSTKKLHCFLPKHTVQWLLSAADNPLWNQIPIGFHLNHYTPNHWVFSKATHELNILDMEDSGVNFLSMDIVILWYQYFTNRHDLMTAFFEGYGKTVTPEYVEELRYVSILYGLELMTSPSKDRDSNHFHMGIEILQNVAEGTFPSL